MYVCTYSFNVLLALHMAATIQLQFSFSHLPYNFQHLLNFTYNCQKHLFVKADLNLSQKYTNTVCQTAMPENLK